jgi:S-adenosylmethionine decarboxylase
MASLILAAGAAAPAGDAVGAVPADEAGPASEIRLISGCTVSSLIMPGIRTASGQQSLRRPAAAAPKVLYAVDARLTPSSPVTDVAQLTSLATAAVQAADGHVLSANHVMFPNGAVTLVLILAESHLSIHTWPEEDLIAIDLFSCGAIDGAAVVAQLGSSLRLADARTRTMERGLGA